MSIFNIFSKKNEQNETKKEDFYNSSSIALPQNFAQKVMELQMQLQFTETYNMELIQQLNELYRIAIQYYINIDQKKANHFKSKLTSLLTHPNTLYIIQQKSPNPKTSHLDSVSYVKNLKQQLGKFNCQSEIVVKNMMEGSQKKLQKNHRLICQNLTIQEKKLQKRLEERSRSKSKRKTDAP